MFGLTLARRVKLDDDVPEVGVCVCVYVRGNSVAMQGLVPARQRCFRCLKSHRWRSR